LERSKCASSLGGIISKHGDSQSSCVKSRDIVAQRQGWERVMARQRLHTALKTHGPSWMLESPSEVAKGGSANVKMSEISSVGMRWTGEKAASCF
jgi:hypothetical protein